MFSCDCSIGIIMSCALPHRQGPLTLFGTDAVRSPAAGKTIGGPNAGGRNSSYRCCVVCTLREFRRHLPVALRERLRPRMTREFFQNIPQNVFCESLSDEQVVHSTRLGAMAGNTYWLSLSYSPIWSIIAASIAVVFVSSVLYVSYCN